jgi:aminoglycoside phosphotransferase (APT) family kinase protein
MESLTKRKVTDAEIGALVERAFPGAGLASATELTDGWFNAVYDLRLGDGRDVVLKIAPPPGTRTLAYEHDMMRGELEFFQRAAGVGAAVPELLHADTSRTLIESDWLFMAKLHGETVADLTKTLTEEELGEVRRELGRAVARLHSATSTTFGYPNPASRSRQATWRGSFLAMVDDVLRDGVELGVELPWPRIAEVFDAHADALDAVTVPRLVHYDLWDNNAFVVEQDGRRAIEGIIDGERAFYGDPLAEFVALDLGLELEHYPTLLAGYEEVADWPLAADPGARRRLGLYKIYLGLIMFTEGPTRGFAGPAHQAYLDWIGAIVQSELEVLDQSRVTTPTPRARARHHERITS